MSDEPTEDTVREVLSTYGLGGGVTVEPVSVGLINHTYLIKRDAERRILQRLHPVFAGEVNLDIDAVTRHLDRQGFLTPRLLRTTDDRLWVGAADGIWRMMTYVHGRVLTRVQGPEVARAGARQVAAFHRALSDCDHTFHFGRAGVHDTERHLERLQGCLSRYTNHRSYARVAPIGERILERAALLPGKRSLPRRIVHGDLKISNLLFDDSLTRCVALIDLDTLARGTVFEELGDALRSWCNSTGESKAQATLDLEIFEAAVSGYAEAAVGLLSPDEVASIVPGMETIALELASRFCTDALEESYFGWDPARFSSRSKHNQVRALSQLTLAEAVGRRQAELQRVIKRAFNRM